MSPSGLSSLLSQVPAKYLRLMVIPVLLAVLGWIGNELLAQERAWRAKVDSQVPRVERLDRKIRAIHRDLLQFQLAVYEDRGMKERAREIRLRLYHMDRLDLVLDSEENE